MCCRKWLAPQGSENIYCQLFDWVNEIIKFVYFHTCILGSFINTVLDIFISEDKYWKLSSCISSDYVKTWAEILISSKAAMLFIECAHIVRIQDFAYSQQVHVQMMSQTWFKFQRKICFTCLAKFSDKITKRPCLSLNSGISLQSSVAPFMTLPTLSESPNIIFEDAMLNFNGDKWKMINAIVGHVMLLFQRSCWWYKCGSWAKIVILLTASVSVMYGLNVSF